MINGDLANMVLVRRKFRDYDESIKGGELCRLQQNQIMDRVEVGEILADIQRSSSSRVSTR